MMYPRPIPFVILFWMPCASAFVVSPSYFQRPCVSFPVSSRLFLTFMSVFRCQYLDALSSYVLLCHAGFPNPFLFVHFLPRSHSIILRSFTVSCLFVFFHHYSRYDYDCSFCLQSLLFTTKHCGNCCSPSYAMRQERNGDGSSENDLLDRLEKDHDCLFICECCCL